jgi:hypothetical protein
VRYLAIRTLLRLAKGIEGKTRSGTNPRWSPPTSVTRLTCSASPSPPTRPPHCCTPSRLHPLDTRNDIFAGLAACTLLGLNDIIVKATPDQALTLVQSAENGELDETAIAAQLAAFSDRNPR